MTEKQFRLISGPLVLLIIYLDSNPIYYAFIGIQLLEGITNQRIPIIISRLRHGKDHEFAEEVNPHYRINFHAERMLRFTTALFISCAVFLMPEHGWMLSSFVGLMLLLAGLTSICPMILLLRMIGFK
jgi:hypothetical protein